jgi:hypothetical protein
LAKKMGREIALVEENVEAMAREGTVMVTTSRRDGKKYYSLWSLMPGILESTYADGIDSDRRRHLSRLLAKYDREGLCAEFASSNYPHGRIVPVNRTHCCPK